MTLTPVPLTVGSLFAGIGGFDLGFERAGGRVLWQSEKGRQVVPVLSAHWPQVPNLGDVRRVDHPPSVDVLCGGFPCQDVSIAVGRRKGFAGDRSSLFLHFVRIAAQIRPRWVVIENVAGLLSSREGRDMATVVGSLADCGYHDVSWRVVDSAGFGVPQRRRRVFIVGRLGVGAGSRRVLLEPEGRRACVARGGEAPTVVGAITAHGPATGADDRQAAAGQLVVTADGRVRQLTVTECERLQGFPDGWTSVLSKTAALRALGNAVTVPVVEWLARRIAASVREHSTPAEPCAALR